MRLKSRCPIPNVAPHMTAVCACLVALYGVDERESKREHARG